MSLDRLHEAFKMLDALNEEMFDTSLDGINSLADAMEGDNSEDIIKITDVDAETEEDIQDSYLGKVILDCNVCHSLRFADKGSIEIDDSGIVNGEEVCPYCGEASGFTVVGQIEEFEDGDGQEIEDDEKLDDNASEPEEKDTTEGTTKNESMKRRGFRKQLHEGGKSVDFSKIKKLGKKLIKESSDVTDQIEIDTKEAGYITKKKDLEKQGYKVLHTGNGKITMAKPKAIKESKETLPSSFCVDTEVIEWVDLSDEDEVKDAVIDLMIETYGVEPISFDVDVNDDYVDVINIKWGVTESEKIKGSTVKSNALTESPYYLDTKYDSRKSFYNKASVSDDTNDLYSYGVHVMTIKDGKPRIVCREDQLSQTTLRHIKEFLKQKGFPAISKQQIIKDYLTECAGKKCITEDFRYSDYADVVLDHFDYSGVSDEFLSLVCDLVERVDDFSDEEEIWEAIDSGMIYTKDQWTAYMHYCDMGDSTDKMYEGLFGDLFAICAKIANKQPPEINESIKSYMKSKLTKRFVEGFNNINVETDDQKLTMTQDANGKVVVTTEPVVGGNSVDATIGGEAVAPVGEDTIDELIGADEELATEEEEPVAEEEGEEPAEEEATDEEAAPEDDVEFQESLKQPVGRKVKEDLADVYRKTFDKPASWKTQQRWEDALTLGPDELSDKQRKRYERKFAQQRDWERRHPDKAPNPPVIKPNPRKNEVDVEIDEFDEVSFNALGEKYLKGVYENVSSFQTTNIANNDRSLIIEGVISFASGAKKKTGFIFEADTTSGNGLVRFVGGNKHFSNSKKAFIIEGRVKDRKLVTESFSYNYRPGSSKKRIVGKISSK